MPDVRELSGTYTCDVVESPTVQAPPSTMFVAAPNAFTVVAVVFSKAIVALPATIPVVIVGEVPNTNAPVPVSSVSTPANCALVVAANCERFPVVRAVFATSPVFVPLRLLPLTAPDAATLVGVIAPSVKLIAGVVVAVATVPLTPFAVVTETLVTVPVAESTAFSVVPLILRFVPRVIATGNPVPPLLACPSSFEAVRLRP